MKLPKVVVDAKPIAVPNNAAAPKNSSSPRIQKIPSKSIVALPRVFIAL